ncbi:MAG: DegV family protein [Syntrophomonadaceae bacterium]|jgi:DegV family protein with EDD domain|nr:DegV family protein [Syntrophomonadaceae bacterium]
MKVQVISDSTSYLPTEIINKYQINIIPLNVHFDGEVFKEGSRYSNREYYDKLKKSTSFPSTSQPSAGQFLEVFQQLEPDTEALAILLSSKISGTYQSAHMAREMMPERSQQIHLFDSYFSGMGLGFQVIAACEMLTTGNTIEEVIQGLEIIKNKMRLFFVVENLEYLSRGGRMSTISCKLGTLLQLKPVLSLENGQLALFQKARTLPRAMAVVLAELEKVGDSVQRIAILNVESQEKAQQLRDGLEDKYHVPVSICDLGPVVGSHLGPGSLGIVYY